MSVTPARRIAWRLAAIVAALVAASAFLFTPSGQIAKSQAGSQFRSASETLRQLFPAQANHRIVAFGDSLTAGRYPHYLAMSLGVPVENLGVGGETSDQILKRVLAYPKSSLSDATVIFWMGQNDWNNPNLAENVRRAIIHVGHHRYLVLGVVRGDYPERNPADYNAQNARLAKYNFVDIPKDLGAQPTPSELRIDRIHLNNSGYRIVAKAIEKEIKARHW